MRALRIFVRYQGLTLLDQNLEPRDHTLGRSTDNDLVIPHDSISRKHAKISIKDGEWWYEDIRFDHPRFYKEPIPITDDSKIIIENEIELITEGYLNSERTRIVDLSILPTVPEGTPLAPPPKTSSRWIWFAAASVAISGLLVFAVFKYFKPMEPSALYHFVRPKVVEFVKDRDPKAIKDFKKYAEIKDAEFADDMGFCTGFLIAPEVVLTANHCVHGTLLIDGEEKFKIKMHDGKLFSPKKILGFDLKRDFAFIEVEGTASYGFLEISQGEFNIGEKVYTIGNVSGEGIAIRDGITASKTKDANDPSIEFIRYSAAASPGNSGGPLIDGFGKIIALVFAATRSENYNLGTGADHLQKGKVQFVDNRSTKSLKLETRHLLNYRPDSLTYLLYLPISDTWYEHPDLLRPLENMEIDFQVPQDFSGHYDTLIERVNKAVTEKFEEVQERIKQQGLTNEDWSSQVNATVPLLIPHQINMGGLYTRTMADSELIAENIAVLAPMRTFQYKAFLETLKKENKYDYSPLTLGLSLDAEGKSLNRENKSLSFLYRSGSPSYKDRLDGMAWVPIIQFFGSENAPAGGWAELRKFDIAQITKGLIGAGLIGSSYASPYLRPNARREFTITEFSEEVSEFEIKDTLDRTWRTFSWPLFGSGTLDNYCLALPQGVLCLSALHSTTDASSLTVLRGNYVKYVLSTKLVAPIYWKVDALKDFYQNGLNQNQVLMRDVDVSDRKGGLGIKLKTLGVDFEIPSGELPVSIRITSGLMLINGEKKWVGLGFDALFKEKKVVKKGATSPAEQWKVCGMGLEPKGIPSSSVLTAIRTEGELKKELERRMGKAQKEKAEIFKQALTLKSTPAVAKDVREMTLFGFCAPIEKYAESDRLMNIQFFGRKPYQVKVTVLDRK